MRYKLPPKSKQGNSKNQKNMSAFAVFATVLTIGYIIYYGFTISRDIIAGKKADKSDVETFEVEAVNEPKPTSVNETYDGFSISPMQIADETISEDQLSN